MTIRSDEEGERAKLATPHSALPARADSHVLRRPDAQRPPAAPARAVNTLLPMTWSSASEIRTTRFLAAGGYGQVWTATIRCGGGSLQEAVVKFAACQEGHSIEDATAALKEEERILRKLDGHQNIIRAIDGGIAKIGGIERRFLALEHGGVSLGAVLSYLRGPLDPGLAAVVALEVASGLARAHEQGIFHRDVKPGNVMIGPEGTVKLIDFGIAKATDSLLKTTKGDVIKGTLAYCAPEVYRGEGFDARCEVWAVSVLLYVMLTGREPWVMDRALPGQVQQAQLMTQILTQAPPRLPPAVPALLADFVFRGLDKNPAARFADPALMARELEKIAVGLVGPWSAHCALGALSKAVADAPGQRGLPVSSARTIKVGSTPGGKSAVGVGPELASVMVKMSLRDSGAHGSANSDEHEAYLARSGIASDGIGVGPESGEYFAASSDQHGAYLAHSGMASGELDPSAESGPTEVRDLFGPTSARGRPARSGRARQPFDSGMGDEPTLEMVLPSRRPRSWALLVGAVVACGILGIALLPALRSKSALGSRAFMSSDRAVPTSRPTAPREPPKARTGASAPPSATAQVAASLAPITRAGLPSLAPEPVSAKAVDVTAVASPVPVSPAPGTDSGLTSTAVTGPDLSRPAERPLSSGSLDVIVAPRGALVSLDGREPVPAPAAFPRLRTGTHVLRIGLGASSLSRVEHVKVEPGSNRVRYELANPFAEE